MTYFVDSSSLFKLFFTETGTASMEALVLDSSNLFWTAQLTRIEFASTLMRRLRGGLINKKQMLLAETQFELLWNTLLIIPFDLKFIPVSENFIKSIGMKNNMRTLDALQLAAFQSQAQPNWIFLTADTGFANSIASLGIKVQVT